MQTICHITTEADYKIDTHRKLPFSPHSLSIKIKSIPQSLQSNDKTITDMPTFENQNEESLTTEARRADNRGPKGR